MLHSSRVSARVLSRHLRGLLWPVSQAVGQVSRLQPVSRQWMKGSNGRLFSSALRCCHEIDAQIQDRVPLGYAEATAAGSRFLEHEDARSSREVPLLCPGCGALGQTIDADAAGYYGSRRAQKATKLSVRREEEDTVFRNALATGALLAPASNFTPAIQHGPLPQLASPSKPTCDRCHYLLHQSRGTSIIHPSMQSIQAMIEDSPHMHNHIYHVLDAADFPLSLIPNLTRALELPRMRTQNRRSKSHPFYRGRKAEVSFIITRADLLAPQKEQVDKLLPYLRDVLRDALGRDEQKARLGNVRCVSAMRGWWTPVLKEEVWERGGAGWMVGKVNVGKSRLYEGIFPKGRNRQEDVDITRMREEDARSNAAEMMVYRPSEVQRPQESERREHNDEDTRHVDAGDGLSRRPGLLNEADVAVKRASNHVEEASVNPTDVITALPEQTPGAQPIFFDESDSGSLLPPAQEETAYPQMPLVSSLPGTTASPIRIPFGNGKGELIDLPGVHRSSLSTFVDPSHHKDLLMTSRIVPEQHTLKPGQSLLLGGLIRITPVSHTDHVFLAYPFVPLTPHVTSNAKAVAIQTGTTEEGDAYAGTVDTIATGNAKSCVRSAGIFKLAWDVTKQRTGSLTDSTAGKRKVASLPFIVYSADILVEGVGWVELVCQVRNHRRFADEPDAQSNTEESVPEVEIISPEGKFVGVRRPMNGWMLGGPKKVAKHARKGRPRMSIDFQRRKEGGRKPQGLAQRPE